MLLCCVGIKPGYVWICLRASPAMNLTRPLAAFFFHPDGEKRSSRAPGSSFSSGFGPSSIRRVQAIPAPPGRARGLRTKQMRGKRRGKFPRVWWPRLVGEKGRSSSSSHHLPRIVVFPTHRLPRAIKACRRRMCSHAARRVNARPPIYRDLPRV
jgi:hypothetical protein